MDIMCWKVASWNNLQLGTPSPVDSLVKTSWMEEVCGQMGRGVVTTDCVTEGVQYTCLFSNSIHDLGLTCTHTHTHTHTSVLALGRANLWTFRTASQLTVGLTGVAPSSLSVGSSTSSAGASPLSVAPAATLRAFTAAATGLGSTHRWSSWGEGRGGERR